MNINRAFATAVVMVAARGERFEAVEPHMGTLVRITIYSKDDSAIPAAFARVRELDDELSDYKIDSELNRVCRTAHLRPVRVSDDLYRVLSAAQALARKTDGAFDVTVGPVTHLWRQGKLADPETLARCGWRNLVLRDHTVFLMRPGMQLDLGGIAKGFAADEALKVLRKRGVTRALVAVSGDIAVGDAPPEAKAWKIGIEPAGRSIMLNNAAVSTSGDTEQFLESGGVRYSHIIDPKTGLGLTSPLMVTVVARRGVDADAMATAISVLGEARGRRLLGRRLGRLIVATGR